MACRRRACWQVRRSGMQLAFTLSTLPHAGDALFQTHENLEHLAMMEAVLGPIPPQLAAAAAEGVRDLFRR